MTGLNVQFEVLLKDVYLGYTLSQSEPPNAMQLAKELRRVASVFSLLEVNGQSELGQQFLIATLDACASALGANDLHAFLRVLKDANYTMKEVDNEVQSVFGA
jgi:hypothetical protein